mgnify:CR=1 FL=1
MTPADLFNLFDFSGFTASRIFLWLSADFFGTPGRE